MDILYLLIPLSALLVLAILGLFAWANHSGQFDELEAEGQRILDDKVTLDSTKHDDASAPTVAIKTNTPLQRRVEPAGGDS